MRNFEPERALVKVGAVLLVAGAVLGIVANLIHPAMPRGAPVGSVAYSQAVLDLVAGSDFWLADHLAIVVAASLVLGGLVALTRSLSGEWGSPLAQLGLAMGSIALTVTCVEMAIDGLGLRFVADAWASAPAGDKPAALYAAHAVNRMGSGLATVSGVTLGATFVFYGLAVAMSSAYPRSLGWIGAAAGLVAVANGLLGRFSPLGSIPLGIPVAVLILWALVMGLLLWRRAAAATHPADARHGLKGAPPTSPGEQPV